MPLALILGPDLRREREREESMQGFRLANYALFFCDTTCSNAWILYLGLCC
jgi:hypothetical protein